MSDTTSKTFWPLFAGLALLMAATRSHHFASITHLPDASWAVFFLAGFYLRPAWVFAGLLGLAGLSDYVAITQFGVSDFCVSAAYGFLLPAYGALWFAGRLYAARYRFEPANLIWLAGYALAGATISELLSSGGFYYFSGRFAETSLAQFGGRLVTYFPHGLEGLALYLGSVVVAHVALTLASGTAPRRSGAPQA
ncbi:hypothetical protein [Methylococcus sp. EFPC2]|uniref:hypothetical protein n=1 Tax=Methylococcus sp. EFPC2 TaxID=2812648 RepID=UPI001966DA56|nr:hypothetical protein [Methylococcus sp. EFPC2]QSA98658.1 hypothetical protein JWZ97_07665 [Methylococcus sp. EFPC2]